MTKQEAANLIGFIKAAFPTRKISEATVATYTLLLIDLDFPTAQRATVKLLRTMSFWPSVPDIREAYDAERKREISERPRLVEPEVSEEQRLANLERLREISAGFGARV